MQQQLKLNQPKNKLKPEEVEEVASVEAVPEVAEAVKEAAVEVQEMMTRTGLPSPSSEDSLSTT